jgi:transcriptional regulator with XRE-family HTH domain
MQSLRTLRLERLLSVERLSKLAGVSNRTILDIEHGMVRPKLRTIGRLSEALEVAPIDVLEFVPVVGGDRWEAEMFAQADRNLEGGVPDAFEFLTRLAIDEALGIQPTARMRLRKQAAQSIIRYGLRPREDLDTQPLEHVLAAQRRCLRSLGYGSVDNTGDRPVTEGGGDDGR